MLDGPATLNGYSGYLPLGCSLWEVEAPDYEKGQKWINLHKLGGRICRLEIGE
jgi:hypothetical protein